MRAAEHDIFRKAIEKVRTLDHWERLDAVERAELISRCLRHIFDTPPVRKE